MLRVQDVQHAEYSLCRVERLEEGYLPVVQLEREVYHCIDLGAFKEVVVLLLIHHLQVLDAEVSSQVESQLRTQSLHHKLRIFLLFMKSVENVDDQVEQEIFIVWLA